MFDVAKGAAGLTPADVAKLLKVSRVTVSLWFNGHSQPHALHANKVQKLLDAIGVAVDAGDLPIPRDASRRDRGDLVRKAVEKHLGSGSSKI